MADKTPYTVQKGDTLWALSEKFLGDPMRWQEIWHLNHEQYASPDVRAKLRNSKFVENPDLIFVGQKIFIPVGDAKRQIVNPGPGDSGKTPAKDKVRMIPYKYNIERKIFETPQPPGFKTTVTVNGAITIQSEKTVSWAEFNQDGFDIKVAKNYETPLNKLVSEFQLGINQKTRQIDFSSGVTMHSGGPYATKHSAMLSVNPITGMPTYTTTITYPEIKGKLNEFAYSAVGYSVAIKMEKIPEAYKRVPVLVPAPQRVPVKAPSRSGGMDWAYAAGALLLIGATAIVIATVVEDVITLGAGLADDPASFAAAAAMTTRGMSLLRGGQVVSTRLGGAALAY